MKGGVKIVRARARKTSLLKRQLQGRSAYRFVAVPGRAPIVFLPLHHTTPPTSHGRASSMQCSVISAAHDPFERTAACHGMNWTMHSTVSFS